MEDVVENDDNNEINNEMQGNMNVNTNEKDPICSNVEINHGNLDVEIDQNNEETSVPDSVENTVESDASNQEPEEITAVKKKRLAVIDSDSEDEETPQTNKTPNNEQETYSMTSKGELILETSNKEKTKSKWSALCDSESSEDEVDNEPSEEEKPEEETDDVIQPTQYKKKPTRKQKEKEPKKMTGKDALKLRKEIQSESQRMIRETKVSLPYHKPKQFSLKEFLSRRPKLSSTINLAVKMPLSVAIKMPKEQLEVISKIIEEREKEVKNFYKSDSGSDNDEDDDPEYKPENENEENPKGGTQNAPIENESNENDNKEPTNDSKKTEENDNTEILSCDDQNCDSGIDTQETQTQIDDITGNEENQTQTQIDDNTGNEENPAGLEVQTAESSKDSCNVIDSGIMDDQTEEQSLTVSITNEMSLLNSEKMQVTDPIQEELEDRNVLASKEGNNESQLKRLSDDFDFSIDDIEETETESFEPIKTAEDNTEILSEPSKIDEDQNSKHASDKDNNVLKDTNESAYRYDDLDKEIEAFGIETKEVKKDLSISELLREKFANSKPRLSGTPNDVIDLESGVTKPREIVSLMKRFQEHTAKKPLHKHRVKLNIVSVESQGNIEKEELSMDVDEDESVEVQEKPGVRLLKLRNELQSQIAKKKYEMWQNKSSKPSESVNEEENEDGSSKPDYEADVDDILDDEDEEEMSESSEEEEIEDEEVAEKKQKSAFIDEEAEESDVEAEVGGDNDDGDNDDGDNDDGDNDDGDNDDGDNDVEQEIDEDNDEELDDDSDKENKEVDVNDLNENSESTNISETDQVAEPIRKPLRRIVKGFTEDSDDEEDSTIPNNKSNEENKNANKINEEDDMIPPHQIPNTQTPVKENSQQTQNSFGFDFLTPVSYITGIKNLANSSSRSVKGSPTIFPLAGNPNLPSPLKENDWQSSLQKKLFVDNELPYSQADNFPTESPSTQSTSESQDSNNQTSENQIKDNRNQNQNEIFPENSQPFPNSMPTSQDLLNVCSGEFTGTSQVSETTLEKVSKNNVETLTLNDYGNERKCLDIDHDVIISQLLDEEEMEKFKKKFDSPGISNTQKGLVENKSDFEDVHVTGVLDSDDDDEEEMKIKRKKNKSKLTFSDDDSSEESDVEKEEEIDLHDEDNEEDDENEIPDPQPNNIDYDSEENEIELEEDNDEEEEEKEKGTANFKASDFFEEEAELSESEWGSADEDEKDLDNFEVEAGDTEKFDEKKLRSDLEKIHMRRMLDEDQREVKLLQELLLEDGELHGTGRQRQFKWKNIDTFDGEAPPKTEDDIFLDEDESEEQWRKKRYEREQFLKEKQMSLDIDLLSNSQILKVGHKLLERSTSSTTSLTSTPTEAEEEETVKTVKNSLIFSNKRGSFLNRGDQVLQRIAEYNKVTETVVVGGTAKNSRKFLFQTVSVEESTLLKDKKRKAADGTPNVIKKLRLSENLSPANRHKKLVDPKAKTKLF